jgi:tetratricopeptide (TPR) repeat protein
MSDVVPPGDRLKAGPPPLIRGRVACIACVAVASIAFLAWYSFRSSPEALARAARQSLLRGDLDEADRLVGLALGRAPQSGEVLVAAGEVAAQRGDQPRSIDCYLRASADDSPYTVPAAAAASELLIKAHQWSQAEGCYRRILAIDSHNVLANRRLAALLILGGRRRESAVYLFELVRLGECDADELALLGNLEQIFDDEEVVKRYCEAAPDDPLPQLGAARISLQKNQVADAVRRLERLVARAPDQREARVTLGKALFELGANEKLVDWDVHLPGDFDDHPDVWVIRGQLAERRGDINAATRCYWEVLRRDPNVWLANYQLARLLAARGDGQSAAFLERASDLKALADLLKEVLLKGVTAERAMPAGRLTEALGRPWEAIAWYRFAQNLDPAGDAEAQRRRLAAHLDDDTPRMLESAWLARNVDFSDWPLPDWKTQGNSPAPGERAPGEKAPLAHSKVRFRDDAQSAGIAFTYENGDDPAVDGMRTWQSFGGGVAVLDFDGDGWPDLHFTQGGRLGEPPDGQPTDRLFRNLGDGKFSDVTLAAGVDDRDYSQGAAAGDYDNDGFLDVYVANIGRNRLYHNNGDGTFADVTQAAGIEGDVWTASCLVADLNGDGLPDIYDVTYVAGRKPFTLICESPVIHENRICPPQVFDGEEDRLHLNLGDGTFLDVSAEAGIWAPEGKGLGAVAADFELSGRLNLFVANDMAANFYFLNETASPGAPPRFSERAILAGCAYNGVGRSQANMGIAVADADGDGLLDFYVSTFFDEYNVLYLQRPAGMFVDGTGESRLKGTSAGMLGFGTQFLDADLDGWPDLVVANGHVDDYTKKGTPFRMRPQFFLNLGQGRFEELPPSELGEYFERRLLGRGLARLDWNRDGRDDFVVSHLDTPAALVTNQSPTTGHFLALQLRGVESNRDAVGAVVWLTVAGRTRMQQVTAGDGYYASNQKQLLFGLGASTEIEKLIVRWPGGLEQPFELPGADGEYVLVEGRARAVRLLRRDSQD